MLAHFDDQPSGKPPPPLPPPPTTTASQESKAEPPPASPVAPAERPLREEASTRGSTHHQKPRRSILLVAGILLPFVVGYVCDALGDVLYDTMGMYVSIFLVLLVGSGVVATCLIRKWWALLVVPLTTFVGAQLPEFQRYPDFYRTSLRGGIGEFLTVNGGTLLVTSVLSLLGVSVGLLLLKKWPDVLSFETS